MNTQLVEEGITCTVKTSFSSLQISDIITQIADLKGQAVLRWIRDIQATPSDCLIIGAYLTGARIASILKSITSVTVFDQSPLLRNLLEEGIPFVSSLSDLADRQWDLIIDTTGLGGIPLASLHQIGNPEIFLVEDPCSDASDECIKKTSQSDRLLREIPAARKGRLYTGGILTKTSGTMSLTGGVIARAMQDATSREGVLYATTSLTHVERILFRETNFQEYVDQITKPALIISSLTPVDPDALLQAQIAQISSNVLPIRDDS